MQLSFSTLFSMFFIAVLSTTLCTQSVHAQTPPDSTTPVVATPSGDNTPATPEIAPNTGTPTEVPATETATSGDTTPANTTEGTPETATPNAETPANQADSSTMSAPIEEKQEVQTEAKEETTQEAKEDASSHFTIEAMWTQSSQPVRMVIGTLLFMLVLAIGVGMERLITLTMARSQSRKIAGAVSPLLKDGKTKEALTACKQDNVQKSYLAHLLAAGLTEFAEREDTYGIEAVERAIEKNAIVENASLHKGLNILATVGSTAPFVGLVGTIFGIINAFGQIGAEGGADLTTLAPAIGEALITTAFGIIVAIVGVWLFNFFTATIENITNDMSEASQELLDWCHKRIRPAMDSSTK